MAEGKPRLHRRGEQRVHRRGRVAAAVRLRVLAVQNGQRTVRPHGDRDPRGRVGAEQRIAVSFQAVFL